MSFIEVVAASMNLMFGFLITRIGPLQPKLWSISQDYRNLGYLSVCVQILGLVFIVDFILILGLI